MKQTMSNAEREEILLKRAGVTLTADEKLITTATIHDAIYWKGVAVIVLGMVMIPTMFQNLGFMLVFVGGIMIALADMARRFLMLAATNKRIFVRSGYVYSDMIELRHSQIESIEVGMMFVGQIFGYGSVIVSGTGQRRIMVPYVKDAIGFRRKVNDVLVNK